MERINNNYDEYLYCSISSNPSDYSNIFSSGEECFNSLTVEIKEECKKRNYTENETEKILTHYEIKFKNWSGKWIG